MGTGAQEPAAAALLRLRVLREVIPQHQPEADVSPPLPPPLPNLSAHSRSHSDTEYLPSYYHAFLVQLHSPC